MSIHGYIMLVVAALEIALVLYLLTYQKSPITLWYVVFVIGVAAYVITNAITYLNLNASVYVHLTQWFAGAVLTAAFLMFALYFPFRSDRPSQFESLIFWVPVLLFFVILYVAKDFIVSLDPRYLPAKQSYGLSVWTFPAFFVLYWVLGIGVLIQRLRRADGIHRWQLKTLLFGAILAPLLFSTIFDVFLPIFGVWGFGWIGAETTIIWLGFTAYIIRKK